MENHQKKNNNLNLNYNQTKIKQLMKHYVEDMKKEEVKRIVKDNSIATDFLTK